MILNISIFRAPAVISIIIIRHFYTTGIFRNVIIIIGELTLAVCTTQPRRCLLSWFMDGAQD